MDSVEFHGNSGDMERFARGALKRTVTFDQPSPFEQRMRWNVGGQSGWSSSTRLQSGLALSTTKLIWDQPWGFQFRDAPTALKFMVSRGEGPRMTVQGGPDYVLGRSLFQVRHTTRAMRGSCQFGQEGGNCEHVALELQPQRLRELLGTEQLPPVLHALLVEPTSSATHAQSFTSPVSRLLDEIVYCDARAASRPLFLEAKGLELLGLLIDELELANPSSPLGRRDRERLEQARRLLVQRMINPPTLAELARCVGLNEAKLKAGFRTLFGTSAFAYLREQRMETARGLLAQRDLSVSEVALRVGFANPSKFAAAFRKHFGIPPSVYR